jgi:transcriptional regulator NrdR family protein
VRYASVYRSFKDISSFMSELKKMMRDAREMKKETGGDKE